MPYACGTPSVPPGENAGAHACEIDSLAPRYLSIHTPLSRAQFFNLDGYAKDCKCDKDFNPDLLTDEVTSTG